MDKRIQLDERLKMAQSQLESLKGDIASLEDKNGFTFSYLSGNLLVCWEEIDKIEGEIAALDAETLDTETSAIELTEE